MEPSSGQVIKRSSFFGFNLDSNLDLVGFYGVEIFIKYAGILFTYYIIIVGGGGQNWPKVDDVIYERSPNGDH